jgi:hypothetical protein
VLVRLTEAGLPLRHARRTVVESVLRRQPQVFLPMGKRTVLNFCVVISSLPFTRVRVKLQVVADHTTHYGPKQHIDTTPENAELPMTNNFWQKGRFLK